MKKFVVLSAFIGGIGFCIGAAIGEVKAHVKYRKGFNDGANFMDAMYTLKDAVDEIAEKHNSKKK